MWYTQTTWIGLFVLLFVLCIWYDRSVEGGGLCRLRKVGCRWLLTAVFISAASAPYLSAFEGGDTLSEKPPSIQNTRSKYICKNNKRRRFEPDIEKWPGVGPTHTKNLRLTPKTCFLLTGLHYTYCKSSKSANWAKMTEKLLVHSIFLTEVVTLSLRFNKKIALVSTRDDTFVRTTHHSETNMRYVCIIWYIWGMRAIVWQLSQWAYRTSTLCRLASALAQ